MSQATCALHGCTTATDVEWLSYGLLICWPFLSLRDDSPETGLGRAHKFTSKILVFLNCEAYGHVVLLNNVSWS